MDIRNMKKLTLDKFVEYALQCGAHAHISIQNVYVFKSYEDAAAFITLLKESYDCINKDWIGVEHPLLLHATCKVQFSVRAASVK